MTECAERDQRGTEAERAVGRIQSETAAGHSGEKQYEALLWTSSSRTRDTCKVNQACCRDEVNNQPQGRWVRLATAVQMDSGS